jgi:hypothetical protein
MRTPAMPAGDGLRNRTSPFLPNVLSRGCDDTLHVATDRVHYTAV